jgi:BlaI family transcriptional regulator, penicillinase repressor
MARTPLDVTDAELDILHNLWDKGEATTRYLTDVLHPGGSASHYATVQKLLERLEAKQCVTRDRGRWPHVFSPAIDRDELIGRRLRAMAEKLCGGSLTPLLTHLLKIEQLSPRERAELRAFMDDLEDKSRKKGSES